MRWGIITFPGSNCDRDMHKAIKAMDGHEPVELWHNDTDLKGVDVVIVPGGFSYGDYLRSGAIARFAPIMKPLISFANEGGFVMGVCNGFQILTEAGLLPGALLKNTEQKFICGNVFVEVDKNTTSMSPEAGKILNIPIAHGEGRFYASEETLAKMNQNGQILLRYTLKQGPMYNGSTEAIAGITNEKGNVWGMMPHPERAASPILGNVDGLSILNAFAKKASHGII
jgi:phosphoribosylformylglycinamidine synthase I